MGLIFIYGVFGFFFGFNIMMDYLNEQRINKTATYVVIFLVSITVCFPFGFIFWPLIVMRSIYNSLRK